MSRIVVCPRWVLALLLVGPTAALSMMGIVGAMFDGVKLPAIASWALLPLSAGAATLVGFLLAKALIRRVEK